MEGGRELPAVDCWGLLRLAYHQVRGVWLPLLKTMDATCARQKTIAHRDMLENLLPCDAGDGVIAALMAGRLCEHVAIILEIECRLYALETTPETGPRMMPIADFERYYDEIRYYTYAHTALLSERF